MFTLVENIQYISLLVTSNIMVDGSDPTTKTHMQQEQYQEPNNTKVLIS
jgi:hypothetical protein